MTSLPTDALVLDRATYASRRAEERRRIMPLRALRRIRLGEHIALAFENRDTLVYQAQEMLYAEGVTDPALAAHEAEAYGRLLPSSHQLCATFFVELDDEATVRRELTRLRGVQHAVRIEVGGDSVAGVELPGPDESGPSTETVSVHFLRFTFSDAQRDAFRDPAVEAALVVDHPEYKAAAAIGGETRLSLIADLNL